MGHKPNEPRKKKPVKPKKNPNMARPPSKNPFARQHQTPEGRAKFREMLKNRKNKGGRPLNVPDGYSRETIKPIIDQAKEDAKKAVSIMKQEYDIENARAEEALETAVEIMRTPVHNRDRLQAAKLILDFTKVKPVAKSEITVGKAEEFLSSLLDTNDGADEEEAEEQA